MNAMTLTIRLDFENVWVIETSIPIAEVLKREGLARTIDQVLRGEGAQFHYSTEKAAWVVDYVFRDGVLIDYTQNSLAVIECVVGKLRLALDDIAIEFHRTSACLNACVCSTLGPYVA